MIGSCVFFKLTLPHSFVLPHLSEEISSPFEITKTISFRQQTNLNLFNGLAYSAILKLKQICFSLKSNIGSLHLQHFTEEFLVKANSFHPTIKFTAEISETIHEFLFVTISLRRKDNDNDKGGRERERETLGTRLASENKFLSIYF